MDSDGLILDSMLVYVPATETDGFTIDLNWKINQGNGYFLTTNSDLNIENFGNNSPLFKRTSGIIGYS